MSKEILKKVRQIEIRTKNIANIKIIKIIFTYLKIKKCRKHIFKLLIINK